MAKIITVNAWRIVGASAVKEKSFRAGESPMTMGVTVTDRDDVREQLPRDATNPHIYSIITKIAGSGNIPVQYFVQETVAAIIAAANA